MARRLTGEEVVARVPQKISFHDAHDERVYAKFIDIARRIVDEPGAIGTASAYISKFQDNYRYDPESLRQWRDLLRRPPAAIARALLEDSPQGRRLRDTAPVFAVISRDEALRLWGHPA
jgi:hypothetical protein